MRQTEVTNHPKRTAVDFQSVTLDHAAAQAAMQPWVEMECFQLSAARAVVRFDHLRLETQRVVREKQLASVQKIGVTPRNFCTISYCTSDPAFRFSDHGIGGEDMIFFMPENTEFDLFVPAGVETTYVCFDQDVFLAAARALEPARWENPPDGVLAWRGGDPSELRTALALLLRTGGVATKCSEMLDVAMIRNALLQMSLAAAPRLPDDVAAAGGKYDRSRALYICRRARDQAEASLEADRLPTILDLCLAAGVSERALQYAFRDYIGMSPKAYLRSLRLNRAHSLLRAAVPRETTVTSVAMRFGFLHFGRFAGDYRQMFGETPSVTLAGPG